MFNFRLASKSFALLACTALLLSTIGCNTGSVTAPDPESELIVQDPSFIRILSTPKGASYPDRAVVAAEMISYEYGGSVSNAWITLDFPAGALDKDTEISINMPEPDKLIVELGPHGIQFNRPVELRINLNGTNAEGMADNAYLLWFNDDMGWWEKLDTASEDPNSFKAHLTHFSKYSGSLGG
ncbi:MAG: hypothetical protein GTO29_11725 [Candidatus Latescibacteria bacterium]|nr:hypothetical protein [Candidatus Latescibacterota bacterium]NIO56835.1 hypothetical protein [Candidatus Latescibacterota bacterium]